MRAFLNQSISNKLTFVIMATTFVALLACVGSVLFYELRSYRNDTIKDLQTQANIMAEVSASAIEFDDPKSATENLAVLRTRPSILRAEIFLPSGGTFAQYNAVSNNKSLEAIERPESGLLVVNDSIHVWQPIVKNNEALGTVYIAATYGAKQRLMSYAIILAIVMCACLALALLVATWLKRAVTKPIFAITNVALGVMQARDFSLRAKKFTEDEIGLLSDAFNDMLGEIELSTNALEKSNESLAREMTERITAEGALRAANIRKDEFLATLAHELRNPLAALTNNVEILRLVKDKPELAEKAHLVMDRQLQQMVRLVNDLLDVSRINTGKLAISTTRVDLLSIVKDAIEISAPLIKTHNHELCVDFPKDPVYILADPLRLAQVFSNILNNAAKYTDPGGKISVKAEVADNEVILSISDTGIGIPSPMLKNIFNMFTQVDQSLERRHAGLGVGLALAKHLCDLHGYELTGASDGADKGSIFTLRIPLSRSRAEDAVDKSIAEAGRSVASKRIMLVDDNVDYALGMKVLLEEKGHTVKLAHDGFEALELVSQFSPDIGFLDIGMPGMSGYELAKKLRELPATKDVVLVAVTGWGQEKDIALSREAGFNHHLVKPVTVNQLVELMNREFHNS